MSENLLEENWNETVVFDGSDPRLPAITLGEFYKVLADAPDSYASRFFLGAFHQYMEEADPGDDAPQAIMAEYVRRGMMEVRGIEAVSTSPAMDTSINNLKAEMQKTIERDIVAQGNALESLDKDYVARFDRRNMLLKTTGLLMGGAGAITTIVGMTGLERENKQAAPNPANAAARKAKNRRATATMIIGGGISIGGARLADLSRDRRSLTIEALESQLEVLSSDPAPVHTDEAAQHLAYVFINRCNDSLYETVGARVGRYVDDIIREMNGDQRKLYKGL